jgi:eukaryotic-like serine/threonine-protein kinase
MLPAGRYQLDEPIGTGGSCQAWRATDTVLSRSVAVKLLHAGYAEQAETLARFKAEAQHAGSLSHPNIARVYAYGEPADGQPPDLVMSLTAKDPALRPGTAAEVADHVARLRDGLEDRADVTPPPWPPWCCSP